MSALHPAYAPQAPATPAAAPAGSRAGARRRGSAGSRPVWAAAVAALLPLLLWAWLLAGVGGDLAAQWAWADFAARHPGSPYDLAWYGGAHPASYSVLAPCLMALLGVEAVAVASGTASASLLAVLVVRSPVRRPLPVALWGAFAMCCNVVAGRVTFALGTMFALAALVVARAGRGARWGRTCGVAGCALLATLASPVAGLFVEVAAAALLVNGRRAAGWALAVPPALVVLGTTALFPFDGIDPISVPTVLFCDACALAVALLCPGSWRTVRAGAVVYAVGAAAVYAVATPVGSNVQRLGLLFGGVVLLGALCSDPAGGGRRRFAALLAAFAATAYWTVGANIVGVPPVTPERQAAGLVAELRRLDAGTGRVEAVPIRNHWESWGLVGSAHLARGWNRQLDVRRNPLFYDGTLTPASYRAWLRRWAVRYVVLPSGPTDVAGTAEAAVVRGRPGWLREVWHDEHWRLYRFTDARPLVSPPATVTRADAARLVLTVAAPGPVHIRVPWSPWLTVRGPAGACLARDGDWIRLEAPAPGVYRIGSQWRWPRGTSC